MTNNHINAQTPGLANDRVPADANSRWFSGPGATYDFDKSALFAVGSRPMMQLIWIVTLNLILLLSVKSSTYESLSPYCTSYTLLLGCYNCIGTGHQHVLIPYLHRAPLSITTNEFATCHPRCTRLRLVYARSNSIT